MLNRRELLAAGAALPLTSLLDAHAAPPMADRDEAPQINRALAAGGLVRLAGRNAPNEGRYRIDTPIAVRRSGTQLLFDSGARLVPGRSRPGKCIAVEGAAPVSWISLSRDVAAGDRSFTTRDDPGWGAGDWVELRANALLADVPNSQRDMTGCGRKIVGRSGSGPVKFLCDVPIPYDLEVSAQARAGKCRMIEDVVIDGATLNDENFGLSLINFGIYLKYCANVKIYMPRAYGSKVAFGPDDPRGDFIKMIHCRNIEIHEPQMRHGSYYGLSILGWTEGVRSFGGMMDDVRHAVSIVHLGGDYGQPVDIVVDGMTSRRATLSSFDTHDIGRDVRFVRCISEDAGDDGFQARAGREVFEYCEAIRSKMDGFSQGVGSSGQRAIGCVARANGRIGVNWNYGPGEWIGGEVSDNGSSAAPGGRKRGGGPGFVIQGGLIRNSYIHGNRGPAIVHGQHRQDPLTVTGCRIPIDAIQTEALRVPGQPARTPPATGRIG